MSSNFKTYAEELDFESVPYSVMESQDGFAREKKLVETADKVALRYKGLEVYVRELILCEAGVMSGRISDFSNVCSTQFESLHLGQKITFRFQYVHHICE